MTIPLEVCEALAPLVVQLRNLDEVITRLERIIAKPAQKDETARRLMTIPGFGPITAPAMAATIQDASSFAGPRGIRRFARSDAQAELIGRQAETRAYFEDGQSLFAQTACRGAHAVLFHRKPHTEPPRVWTKKLIDKKPFKLVAVALANRMARIAMQGFRSMKTLQKFSSVHAQVQNHFNLERHLVARQVYKQRHSLERRVQKNAAEPRARPDARRQGQVRPCFGWPRPRATTSCKN